MVGFPRPEPDAELRALVDAGVLGAVLFARNVGTPEETAGHISTLKRWAGRPFLVSVDQEGGRVARFRGGPFTESRYFGEGVGIAVRRGNDTLRQAFNWALFGLWEKGRFTDLWLRYFPISPF